MDEGDMGRLEVKAASGGIGIVLPSFELWIANSVMSIVSSASSHFTAGSAPFLMTAKRFRYRSW
jgi:hypothetical protein